MYWAWGLVQGYPPPPPADIVGLGQLSALVVLRLDNTKVMSDQVAWLATCSRLKDLHLRYENGRVNFWTSLRLS